MSFHQAVFEIIDMRSFSNLWYWIGLAVLWSSASHWVLGVPYDMVTSAKRKGGEVAADLDLLVAVNIRRRLAIAQTAGLWIVGLVSAVMTMLALLGFVYNVEFAQALFLMAFPFTLVGILGHRTARIIVSRGETGPELWRRLAIHRFWVQVIGIFAIFATSLWGMWRLLSRAFPAF